MIIPKLSSILHKLTPRRSCSSAGAGLQSWSTCVQSHAHIVLVLYDYNANVYI